MEWGGLGGVSGVSMDNQHKPPKTTQTRSLARGGALRTVNRTRRGRPRLGDQAGASGGFKKPRAHPGPPPGHHPFLGTQPTTQHPTNPKKKKHPQHPHTRRKKNFLFCVWCLMICQLLGGGGGSSWLQARSGVILITQGSLWKGSRGRATKGSRKISSSSAIDTRERDKRQHGLVIHSTNEGTRERLI